MAQVSTLPAGQAIPETVFGVGGAGPDTQSPDHQAMKPYWDLARDLLVGAEAVKAARHRYLPKHPSEGGGDYEYRLANGFLTNIYADIIETLAAKPFDDEVQIVDGSASDTFIGVQSGTDGKRKGGLVENIDGRGNHLHVFAAEVFYNGINAAIDWIFVDYPKAAAGLTAVQEAAQNIRPYWYRVPAECVLDVETVMVGGREELIYVRIRETAKVREGYTTAIKQRVREIRREKVANDGVVDAYGVPTWTLYEKDERLPQVAGEASQWKTIDEGTYSIGVIPMVPFICGRRRGSSWVIEPPMKSAAHLQVELYQKETGLKNIETLVCYPMLAANGVNLRDDKGEPIAITIGPHTILNAPPSPNGGQPGSWDFVEPGAESLKFVASRIDAIKQELRELGRQPLTAQSSNLTIITSAFASQKANSAVMAWALLLRDALENALLLTAKWLNDGSEPEVRIKTDFLIEMDDAAAPMLQKMRADGDLSQATYWDEMKRHGVLSPEFDSEEEVEKLKAEIPGGDDEDLEDASA